MTRLGIDLGSTNTLVARVNANGEPEIVQIDGDSLVPSYVWLQEHGGFVIGQDARAAWGEPELRSGTPFRRWKLDIGKGRSYGSFPGTDGKPVEITPESLTTRMVEYLLDKVSGGVGGQAVDGVLVTVPHGWRREYPERCRATRSAAAAARVGGKTVQVVGQTVSEPVAAAAYWVWAWRNQQQRAGTGEDLAGRTVLVCDIGGGTFDLSLVVVDAPDRPLDVVNAIHHDVAGDHADALLLGEVCRLFNETHGRAYPVDARAILERMGGQTTDALTLQLRRWFLEIQNLKHAVCLTLSRGLLGRMVPKRQRFEEDGDERASVELTIDREAFVRLLEPFHARGRELVVQFLKTLPPERLPYAVTMAGGGSRIHGIREYVLEPALTQVLEGGDRAREALDRLHVNELQLDKAIALGAALIANDIVRVRERLLYEVGVIVLVGAALARKLGVGPASCRVLVTPVLPGGSELPSRKSSQDLGIRPMSGDGQKDLSIKLVIADDIDRPWVQEFQVPHPSPGTSTEIDWLMEADPDGGLVFTLETREGLLGKVEGRTTRVKPKEVELVHGEDAEILELPKVSPGALRQAEESLR
jgi:molecular chaperone DnaK